MYYDEHILSQHAPESEYAGFIFLQLFTDLQVANTLHCSLQRQLKERIVFHTQQAIQLNGLLNTRLSIAKLLPEILAEIFLNYAAIVRDARIKLHSHSKQPGRDIHITFYEWMRVTHVCKHWREVALKCANLWTWIAFEERTTFCFIQFLIERSLNLPLTYVHTANPDVVHCPSCIDEDSFYESKFDALDVVKQYLPRIRDLTIFVSLGGEFSDLLWEHMEHTPAPLLEALHIQATGSARPTVNEHGALAPSVSLTDRLFNAQTPRLHSLTLSGVAFRYTHTIIAPTLRHLEIISSTCTGDSDVDDGTALRGLIAHLAFLPNLKTFKLHWWLGLNPLEVHRQQHVTVSLPKLRLLDFNGPELVCHYLAQYIEPLSAGATLRYALGRHCAVPRSTLRHLVGATAGFLRNSSLHAISYGTRESTVVKGLGAKQLLTSAQLWAAPTPIGSDADASQALKSPYPSQSAKRILAAPPSLIMEGIEKKLLAATLQSLDLSRVRTVQIMGFDEGDAWAGALKNAHAVTTLRAVGMAAFGVPAALAAGVPRDIVYDPMDMFAVLGLLEFSIGRRTLEHGGDSEATAGAWYWTKFWGDDGRRDEDGDGDVRMADAVESAANGPALFPKLEVIQLVDVDFAALARDVETERVVRASGDVLERFVKHEADYGFQVAAMLKALRVRRAQGASDVARAEFENCSCADMAQLAPLVCTVNEVWWDGKRVDRANGKP
ncbi:hypothetical protein LXA43DRAFT_1063197 [Ganoderma leucocontextum]|nr:hypothetical protein LXA43DRAFT_1063197 [Ganoderma leucocontextum]